MRIFVFVMVLLFAKSVSASLIGVGVTSENVAVWRYYELDENNEWQYTIEVKNYSDSSVCFKIDKDVRFHSAAQKRRFKAEQEKIDADYKARNDSNLIKISPYYNPIKDSVYLVSIFDRVLLAGESSKFILPKKDSLFPYLRFTEDGKYIGLLMYELIDITKIVPPEKSLIFSSEGLNGSVFYYGWFSVKKDKKNFNIYTLHVNSSKYYNSRMGLIHPELRMIISGKNVNSTKITSASKKLKISRDSISFALPKLMNDTDEITFEFKQKRKEPAKPARLFLYISEHDFKINPDFKNRETWKEIKSSDWVLLPNF